MPAALGAPTSLAEQGGVRTDWVHRRRTLILYTEHLTKRLAHICK